MTDKERQEWVDLKITKDTFKKTLQERVELANAKREHKKYIKEHPEHNGIR